MWQLWKGSTMQRLNNYMRASMGKDRLSHLALLHSCGLGHCSGLLVCSATPVDFNCKIFCNNGKFNFVWHFKHPRSVLCEKEPTQAKTSLRTCEDTLGRTIESEKSPCRTWKMYNWVIFCPHPCFKLPTTAYRAKPLPDRLIFSNTKYKYNVVRGNHKRRLILRGTKMPVTISRKQVSRVRVRWSLRVTF